MTSVLTHQGTSPVGQLSFRLFHPLARYDARLAQSPNTGRSLLALVGMDLQFVHRDADAHSERQFFERAGLSNLGVKNDRQHGQEQQPGHRKAAQRVA